MRDIKTQCHACAAFDPNVLPSGSRPTMEPFVAIWDTGATMSAITESVVTKCGLKPIGMIQVEGVGGLQDSETYVINIGLPNGVGFPSVTVTLAKIRDAQMLIGMDIITKGDFAVTNVGGNTTFSFRIPSIATIDYVKQANVQNAGQFRPAAPKKRR